MASGLSNAGNRALNSQLSAGACGTTTMGSPELECRLVYADMTVYPTPSGHNSTFAYQMTVVFILTMTS